MSRSGPSSSMADANSTAYDEDELVGLISDIYTLMIRLGHIREEDVVWAPLEGHLLNTSLLDPDIRIDDRVMSLMQHLPLPAERRPYEQFCDNMRAINFQDPYYLAASRDIDKAGPDPPEYEAYQPQQNNCRPTDMMLLDTQNMQCPRLVLSVDENVVRMIGYSVNDEAYFKRQIAAEADGYTGPDFLLWSTRHAPTYFREKRDSLLTAESIPTFSGDFLGRSQEVETGFGELQRKLLEDYGWPGADFREQDWKRDGPALVEAVMDSWSAQVYPPPHGNFIISQHLDL